VRYFLPQKKEDVEKYIHKYIIENGDDVIGDLFIFRISDKIPFKYCNQVVIRRIE